MKTKILALANHGKNSVLKTGENMHQDEDFGAQKPHFDAGFRPFGVVFFWLQKPLNQGVLGHVRGVLCIGLQSQLSGRP